LDGPVLAGPVDGGQRAGAVGADRDRAGACARRRKVKRPAGRGAAVEQQAVARAEGLTVDGAQVVPRGRERAIAIGGSGAVHVVDRSGRGRPAGEGQRKRARQNGRNSEEDDSPRPANSHGAFLTPRSPASDRQHSLSNGGPTWP